VARADSGHAAREDFAALLHELREDVGALVVDEIHLLDTELADFLLAEVLTLAAARAAGAAARTSGSAFAAWSAVSAAWSTMTSAGAVTAAAWTAGSG
jgi:replicative superfamily II helicase